MLLENRDSIVNRPHGSIVLVAGLPAAEHFDLVAWHVMVRLPNIHDATYTLLLTDITDVEDDSELGGQHTTGTVAVGGSVTGTLDAEGDLDWFRVDLEMGRTYRFRMRGAESEGGTLADPFMRIWKSDPGIATATVSSSLGLQADNDNRSASERDSEITYRVESDGVYYVEAATYGTGAGTYTIEVEDVTN